MWSPIIAWIADFNLRTERHSRNQASVRSAKMAEQLPLCTGLCIKVISYLSLWQNFSLFQDNFLRGLTTCNGLIALKTNYPNWNCQETFKISTIQFLILILFYDIRKAEKEGFKKTEELGKAHGFYRQDYCGCIYSKR